VLFLTGFSGLFDVPDRRVIALWVLAVGSTITIVQRLVVVYRQAAR
jgi:CDP-diacylglycerol--glycerol-3-phosphate 3-phosphatidyltransferase/CDP-diacylglycerol--inositol 3-phosphatidyltransferase